MRELAPLDCGVITEKVVRSGFHTAEIEIVKPRAERVHLALDGALIPLLILQLGYHETAGRVAGTIGRRNCSRRLRRCSAASQIYFSSSTARWDAVCSLSTRARARSAMARRCSSLILVIARTTSSLDSATTI